MKTKLPENIARKMDMWRAELIGMPNEYIDFHRELAWKEIDRLKTLGFKEVENTRKMASDGWSAGMRLVYIQMVLGKKLHFLCWCDGNQEFFTKCESGFGSIPLDTKEVAA